MSAVERISQPHDSCITTRFEAGLHDSLWIDMARAAPGTSQNFSLALLHESAALYERIRSRNGMWITHGVARTIRYAVMQSAHPEYFSLGGDLRHFRDCIRRGDIQGLRNYAMACADLVHGWATRMGDAATTISLVQGRALGGGFEAALASDFVVAEEHSEFGFPEILFGLFPCSGGMSLLARRIGVQAAERMLCDSRVRGARELQELGVIDVVCARGEGELAVQRFIAEHARHQGARMALQRARRRMAPLDVGELRTVVEDWVELAMRLPAQDLRVMDMLIQMQGARAGLAA